MANIIARVGEQFERIAFKANPVESVTNFPGYGYGTAWGGQNYGSSWLQWILGLGGKEDVLSAEAALENSVVDICLSYIARNFILAEAEVQTKQGDKWQVSDHALAALIAKPNEYYDDIALWAATASSLAIGNAYWIIARDAAGNPRELWWAPHMWDQQCQFGCVPYAEPNVNWGNPYCYRYRVDGIDKYLPLEDVLHFRLPQPDRQNPFVGRNPLRSQLRHISADNSIAQYTDVIAKNFGIVGAAFISKSQIPLNATTAEDIKAKWRAATTGENRGDGVVFPSDFDVKFPDASPEKMAIDKLNNTSEERIPAALGLNPIAVSLGAGLDQSTYNNAQEATRAAWDQGIAPLHQIVAATISRYLLPQFKRTRGEFRLFFNYSSVPSQQEDENALRKSAVELWEKEAINLGQFCEMIRLEVPEGDDPLSRHSDFVAGTGGMSEGAPTGGTDAIADATGVAVDVALNGAQITAALEVLEKLRIGQIAPSVAVSLLNAVGISQENAQAMVDATEITGPDEVGPVQPKAPVSTEKARFKSHATGLVEFKSKAERDEIIRQARELLAGTGPKDREGVLKNALAQMSQSVSALRNGESTVDEWASQTRKDIVAAHAAQALNGYGVGLEDELPEHMWDWLATKVDFHHRHFDGFEKDVREGRYDNKDEDGNKDGYTDGVVARQDQYANATRATYENAGLMRGKDDGGKFGQRIMAAVEHCAECEAEAAKGKVPIDEVAEIGDSTCKANCACVITVYDE